MTAGAFARPRKVARLWRSNTPYTSEQFAHFGIEEYGGGYECLTCGGTWWPMATARGWWICPPDRCDAPARTVRP